MENITELAVIALLSLLMARIILVPVRAGLQLGIRAVGGFLCLWILNLSSGICSRVLWNPGDRVDRVSGDALRAPLTRCPWKTYLSRWTFR